MARRHFPPSIDRRRFLTSAAAAVTATGSILPGVKRADAAAAPDLFQSPPLTLEVEPGNFCAARLGGLLKLHFETHFARKQSCLCFQFRRNCAG
jgi:hypothetical protein